QFGLVVATQTAQAAAAFNDNLKRVNAALSGMIVQITAGMLPTMEQLSNAFVTAAKDSEGLVTVSNIIAGALRALTAIVVGTGGAFAQMAGDWQLVVGVAKLAGVAASLKVQFEAAQIAQDKQIAVTPKMQAAIDAAAASAGNMANQLQALSLIQGAA